jgi:hypothetical protein
MNDVDRRVRCCLIFLYFDDVDTQPLEPLLSDCTPVLQSKYIN